MQTPPLPLVNESSKYDGKTIRWIEYKDHYELIFTDDFVTPSSSGIRQNGHIILTGPGNSLLTDIIMDMRNGDKSREVHVFIGSFGGEVAALNMILQQLLTYDYRVGINLGAACSCGWMLFFACQERYVSPFSQTMYHDISSVCGGKHSELHHNAEFMGKLQQELLRVTDTAKVLTEKELELGRTSEVCLTGQELIDRGAARDYNYYIGREIPMLNKGFLSVGEKNYAKTPFGWLEFTISDETPVPYEEVLAQLNAPPEDIQEILLELDEAEKAAESSPQKKSRSRKKEAKGKAEPETSQPESNPAETEVKKE